MCKWGDKTSLASFSNLFRDGDMIKTHLPADVPVEEKERKKSNKKQKTQINRNSRVMFIVQAAVDIVSTFLVIKILYHHGG